MAITPMNTQTPPIDPTRARTAQEPGAVNAAGETRSAVPGSSREAVRQETNVRILQASLEVSLRAGNEPQALLFRAAIDGINEALAPELGPDAIRNAATQDFSPEATAGRILAFSTGMFDTYAAQRPGDDADQVARDFVELIRGGFEQGFNEARDILDGLGVFNGDVESGAMRTYELFMQGLDDFLAERLTPEDTDASGTA